MRLQGLVRSVEALTPCCTNIAVELYATGDSDTLEQGNDYRRQVQFWLMAPSYHAYIDERAANDLQGIVAYSSSLLLADLLSWNVGHVEYGLIPRDELRELIV